MSMIGLRDMRNNQEALRQTSFRKSHLLRLGLVVSCLIVISLSLASCEHFAPIEVVSTYEVPLSFVPTRTPTPIGEETPINTPRPTKKLAVEPPRPPPILPPPAEVYLPDHSEIKADLVFIQGGTNTNAEVAQGMTYLGFGESDYILRLLDDKFGRTTSYAYYYETPDMCQPQADIHTLLIQVILLKNAEGALGYIEWLQTNPNKVETYPLLDVGEKGYVSWVNSTSPCEMVELYLEFQKYNVMANIQISFNADQISRAEIRTMGIHLAKVIELKLDAVVQE